MREPTPYREPLPSARRISDYAAFFKYVKPVACYGYHRGALWLKRPLSKEDLQHLRVNSTSAVVFKDRQVLKNPNGNFRCVKVNRPYGIELNIVSPNLNALRFLATRDLASACL